LGLPEAAAEIRGSLGRDARGGEDSATRKGAERIALLFGSEKHGLTSEDLSWCHGLIVIDTCDAQPSMNLGQAVAVCLYEISRNPDSGSRQIPGHDGSGSTGRSWRLGGGGGGFALEGVGAAGSTQPTTEQLDRLARLIEETMEAANYATRGMRSANGEALRVLLRRLMPDEADLRRMMGLFRRILWQFGRRDPKV
jgi:tRNA/rRNA methyltransferase